MSANLQMSLKQLEIMEKIIDAHDRGSEISMLKLKEKLSYGPAVSRQAVVCSLKILEGHGLLVRTIRGKFLYVSPTDKAISMFRSS